MIYFNFQHIQAKFILSRVFNNFIEILYGKNFEKFQKYDNYWSFIFKIEYYQRSTK